MVNATVEAKQPMRAAFNGWIELVFHGARLIDGERPLAHRELSETPREPAALVALAAQRDEPTIERGEPRLQLAQLSQQAACSGTLRLAGSSTVAAGFAGLSRHETPARTCASTPWNWNMRLARSLPTTAMFMTAFPGLTAADKLERVRDRRRG